MDAKANTDVSKLSCFLSFCYFLKAISKFRLEDGMLLWLMLKCVSDPPNPTPKKKKRINEKSMCFCVIENDWNLMHKHDKQIAKFEFPKIKVI